MKNTGIQYSRYLFFYIIVLSFSQTVTWYDLFEYIRVFSLFYSYFKMYLNLNAVAVVLLCCVQFSASLKTKEATSKVLSRRKRYVAFPEGSSFSVSSYFFTYLLLIFNQMKLLISDCILFPNRRSIDFL